MSTRIAGVLLALAGAVVVLVELAVRDGGRLLVIVAGITAIITGGHLSDNGQ